MDYKSEIIDKVMESIIDLNEGTRSRVEHALYMQLQDYEISKQITDLVDYSTTNIGLLKRFIATKRLEGKSEKTIQRYQPELIHMMDTINKDLKDIDTFDLRLYLSMYKEERGISNRTLENMRKILSSFFNWLCAEGLISKNPTRSLKQIKFQKKVLKPFTPVERLKMREECTNSRDVALCEFLYASGLRVSEVSSLERNCINFATKEATVIGKGNKERKFYLTDICMEYLIKYLDERSDNNSAMFVSLKSPHDRLDKPGIESAIRRIGKKAGVSDAHPHRFRRTLATDLVRKDVPIQDVAEILGHEDLRTTQVYISMNQEDVKYHYNKAVI